MVDLIRPSRAGDQFHYLWAARRCLALLPPNDGPRWYQHRGSLHRRRFRDESAALADDTVIDIAEYYGDTNPSRAQRVRYMQLKHSTRRAATAWTASGLETTLKGFAEKYGRHLQQFGADYVSTRFEFWFVTNRPVSVIVVQAVDDAAHGTAPRRPAELQKLERVTGLAGAELSSFCGLLHFEDRQDDYWNQRNILLQEVERLPARFRLRRAGTTQGARDAQGSARSRAKIHSSGKPTSCALSETDESSLYPAQCRD